MQIRENLNRIEPPKLLSERFTLEVRALSFDPLNPLFDIFDRKLQLYVEGGFVLYNTREWNDASNPKKFEVFKEPFAVLTIEELEAGFVVCLIPLLLSMFIFCIEWMPTLKDLLVFMSIFNNYFILKQLELSNLCKSMQIKIALWQRVSQKKCQDDEEGKDWKKYLEQA